MRTIETNVYTFEELLALGDSGAVERARDWWRQVSAQDDCDAVSESLAEAIKEAYGPAATVEGWDYGRSSAEVGGRLARPAEVGEGPAFRGWRLIDPYALNPMRELEITEAWPAEGDELYWSRNYGAWMGDGEGDETPERMAAARDYVSAVAHVLALLMVAEIEYRSSGEYVDELLICNEYTFTADGRRFG